MAGRAVSDRFFSERRGNHLAVFGQGIGPLQNDFFFNDLGEIFRQVFGESAQKDIVQVQEVRYQRDVPREFREDRSGDGHVRAYLVA